MAMLLCFSVSVNAQVAKVGDTEYATLQAALDAAAAGTGNVTVAILADVNLTGVDWNPVTVSAPGYPVVTVEGNGKTITGLNDMLFAGTWAGKSGLIIKNLTIANSAIVNDKDDAAGNVGVGAFIGYPQASATITLENCHLKNSSVEGGHWTGGLIGMAGGYNGADGPVFMNLTIKGCSVTGSTITGKGSVGGVIGHGSCAAWTNVVIEETTVSSNTITSTGSSNVKAGAVMGTIGAAGQPTTVNGVTNTGGMSVSATVAENTVKSNGTKITTIYGRQGTETGILYIAGGSYDKYPIEEGVAYAAPAKGYKIVENNGTYGIVEDPEYGKVAKVGDACFETLAQAVAAVEDGGTITLIANETFTENNRYNNGGWWDGLGYSGDKSFTIDLAGFTISQNGALNDYLMWFKNDGAKANAITLKNGTLDAGTSAYCALATASSNAQKITVNLENIQLINNNSNGATLKIRGGAELNANAGTIITGKNSYVGIEAVGAKTVVNIYEGAEIYQNGTSSYCGCLAGASGNSTINVYGGKGQSKSGGFIAMTSGGTINIEGGEWIANTDGTVGNNSNLYVLTAQSNKNESGFAGPSIINVTGGTFRGGMDAWVLNNVEGEKAELNIKGGNFNANPKSYVAENYVAAENNGVWTVVKAAAKIGDKYFATVDAAIKAANGGETVTIFEGTYKVPAMKAGITVVGEGEVLLEGTLSGTLENLTLKNLHIKGGNAQRWAYGKGNLVFENVTFEATSVYALHFDGITAGTNLTYKNCTIIGWAAMGGSPASCVFDGCTIKGNGTYGVIRTYFDTTIKGCTFDVANVSTTDIYEDGIHAVDGAEVVVDNCTNVNGEMKDIVNVHGASVVTIDGKEIKNAAKAGNKYYATFEEAFAAVQAGETLTLLADLNLKEILTINKAITFDGNGKKLTSTAGRAINVSGADGVTIKNLTIDAKGERAINVIQNATNVTVDNVTATAANYTVNVASSAGAAKVAIKNSTLNGLCTVNVSAAGAQVTVDNSTVNCNDNNTTVGESYAALSLNKEAVGGSIIATNSTINVTEGSDSMKGRNGAENGTVTINGSTEGVAVMVAAITYPGSDAYHAFATLKAAIEFAKTGDVVTLIQDVTMDYNARDAYETQAQNVVIDGKGKTLTLNQKNSDWASIGLANNSKLVLNNMTIEKTGYGDTSGAWNTHAIIFSCPVEMNDVTVNNSIAIQAGATLNNVTINEANAYYGLWINGNGQEVTINGGAINANKNGGRGIKIADQYIDAPAQVTLSVDSTVFSTAKKAAVLVSSKAGAKITAANVDIANVAEDSENFVWVDEDWAEYFSEVEVTGATVSVEGADSFAAAIKVNGTVQSYFKTLAEAVKACVAGDNTIELLADCAEKVTIAQVNGTNITINGNGKTYTGTITVKGDKVTNNLYNTETLTFKNINFAPAYNTYAITAEKNTYARNITVDGCTFKGNNDVYGIRVRNGYNYTVKNTTVEGVYTFFNASEALTGLTVENVSVKCANVAFSGAYGFGGASFKNVTVESANNGVKVNNPNSSALTFENCSITAKAPVTFYENAGITSALTAEFNGTNTMVVSEGGTYWFNIVEADATDATFKAIVNDAALDMNNTAFAAAAGNVYYNSMQKAVAAAADGETVTVAKDIELDAANCVTNSDGYSVFVNVAGKAVTIDLNGKAITANLSADQFASAKSSLLMAVLSVDTNGNLTLNDSKGTGKVAVTANDASVYSLISNYDKTAKLTINGGSYELDKARAQSSLIHSDPSEAVVVNDGNFYLGNVGTGANGQPWIFNVNGNNTGHVIVNGGTFNYDVNHQYWAFEVHVDKERALKNNGNGTWTVVPAVAYVLEANNGYTRETGYATLEDAMASKYGNVVTILAGDYTMDIAANKAGVTVQGEVDENGNNLVNITGRVVASTGAIVKNLNVKNEKKGNYDCALCVNGEDIVIDGVNLSGYNGMRYCYATGNVTVKNSVIEGSNFAVHFDGKEGGAIAFEYSTITGWGSYASTIESVTYTNCTLNKGNYSGQRFYCKNVAFNECTFGDGFKIELTGKKQNVAFNDVDMTMDDVKALLKSDDYINSHTIKLNDNQMTYAVSARGKNYATLQAAIDDMPADGVEYWANLKSNNVLTEGVVVPAGKKVTINLNGFNIIGTPAEAKAYAVITNKGTLNITDMKGTGKVICNHTLAGSTGYAVNTITNCGTLTIEDATIENKSTAQYQIGYAIDNNSTSADAVVNIKGGNVIASGSLYYDGIRQFCNSQTKENSVVVSGGEVSTIWMQNPSDGATKNTKDVKGSIAISGGKVGVLSLEPSANFEAAVTGGHFGEISYFQTAEGRDLKEFVVAGTFDKQINETFLALGYQLTGDAAPYTVAYTGKRVELALVDGKFTEFVNEKEIEVGTLTYKRNVLKTWVPIYVPFEIPVSMLAEKFYVARINDVRRTDTNNDGELDDFDMEIIFIHGGNADGSGKTLKANYPYFIKSKSGQTETMEITLTDATLYAAKENVFDCTTMTEKFEIKGNCRLMQANEFDPKNQYTVLTTGEWGHTTSDLKPFRFYMTKSSRYEDEPAAPMNSMRITVRGEEDENGATIIYDVVEDNLNNNGNDFIYDLQGRRVSEPKKGGIYIKNGKKILY